MQIAQPIVHLEVEGGSTYHIHVITWFDQTKFVADGYDTLPTTATAGIFPITLFVAEDSGVPNMNLLTPVVHTITLTGVSLSSGDPFIEVEVINTSNSSSTGNKKLHKDSAGTSAMPDPGTGNRS
jgi:hypothetical protein